MIPRRIHYCWFGKGEKPKLAKKCIESWKKYCPDYEIIEWNESNFDINLNAYTKMCYEQKKWAFLSDYVRLFVVYQHGGIYFDTDVEVVKNFDDLLGCEAFFGFEDDTHINTGEGFGAKSGNPALFELLKEYDVLLDGKHDVIGCPILNTNALMKFGLKQNGEMQNIGNVIIYPSEYFNPYDDSIGIINKTENTYSIHWYGKSWMGKGTILRSKLLKPIRRIFGKNVFRKLKR